MWFVDKHDFFFLLLSSKMSITNVETNIILKKHLKEKYNLVEQKCLVKKRKNTPVLIYFAKTIGQIFPHTRGTSLCVENWT